jgi:hypothetical protein
MSSILFVDINSDVELYETYKDAIKQIGATKLCYSQITDEFLEETMDSCDFLYVHLYNGDIRGFACVSLEHEPDKHLYINLICNMRFHTMETRFSQGKERYSGKNIMSNIIKQGKKLKCKSIRLNAIKEVISYYFNIGFHFENTRLQREIESEKEHIEQLRKSQLERNDDDSVRNLDRIVGRFYPGFYSEIKQRQIGEEDNNDSRKEIAMEDGIPMIYNLHVMGGRKIKRNTYKRNKTKHISSNYTHKSRARK